MVSKTNVQTNISLPLDFDEDQRALAARLIIDKIQANTSMGKDRHGGSFARYSNEYENSLDFNNAGKSGLVNLQLSGDMLTSLELVSSRPGEVVVGYKLGDALAGQVEGNVIGSYGGFSSPSKARPFIGLPQRQIDLIIATVKNQKPELPIVTEEVDGLVESLLKRFL